MTSAEYDHLVRQQSERNVWAALFYGVLAGLIVAGSLFLMALAGWN